MLFGTLRISCITTAILQASLFFVFRPEADGTQEEAECEAENAKHGGPC